MSFDHVKVSYNVKASYNVCYVLFGSKLASLFPHQGLLFILRKLSIFLSHLQKISA